MTTRFIIWGGLLAGLPLILSAHDPITTKITWSQEISRVVYKRCASCHHEGRSVFSLMTYEDARPWAKAIRDQVLRRRMPPWGAVSGIGEFRDDPSLTPAEMDMVVNWVEGGSPEGEQIYLPHRPAFQPPTREVPGRGISVRSEYVLPAATVLNALRPLHLDSGKSMEVTAYLPGGEVRHLIWLRDYRKEWTRTYTLREPVKLPKGTEIRVYADPSASSLLITPKRR